jgi:CheY-like chemotaxis protein
VLLYLAADLIWATRIKGVADALGLPARPVRTLDMLEARLADSKVSAVLLDLDKPDEALAMIERLRRTPVQGDTPRIRILAWGPHVAKDLMQRARDAGADEVLPRGAFDRNLEDILLRLASGGAPESV